MSDPTPHEPGLALKTAVRLRLMTDHASMPVPAGSVLRVVDSAQRPTAYPCVILSPGMTLYAEPWDSYFDTAFLDLHVWSESDSLNEAMAIGGAIRTSIMRAPLDVPGFRCPRLSVETMRLLRDPAGNLAHAIVGVRATLQRQSSVAAA